MSRRVSSAERTVGFTLLELMITIAVIGTLLAVALPKFANAVKVANEGGTRGSLGVMRSSLTIYYGDNEGSYPTDLSPLLTPGNRYLSQAMAVFTAEHGKNKAVSYVSEPGDGDTGYWAYVNAGGDVGKIYIECTHTDSKGTAWNQY